MVLVLAATRAAISSGESQITIADQRPIVRLVAEDVARDLNVAAIKFREPATGSDLLYVRSRGVWRCATTFGAVCNSELMTELLNSFTEARGVLRTRDPEHAEEYGFSDADRLEISFHGPGVLNEEDEDLLLAFAVGSALPGARHGRSFVRPRGEAAIFETDRNSRKLLERAERSSLPPLLDRRLLAGPWEGRPLGFARITVTRPDGETVIEYADLAPDQTGPDGATWTWRVREGDRAGEAGPYIALGFTAFALHSRYSGFANPRDARQLGLLPAAARVLLEPRSGDPIQLVVGQPTPEGDSYIFHEQNRMLMQVDAETARLIAPTAALLLDRDQPNPWELWLSLLRGQR